jgi:hypothetical protein
MSEAEIKLKCLELAMLQARNEGQHGNRQTVAEITTLFYNLTQGTETAPKPQGPSKKPGADKSIFK